jgi:RNA polymerase sigma-70 factor (ECF subfamily)
MTRLAAAYEDLRPLLFSIAYRMLGRVTEAEDVLQEAFVRYQRAVANSKEIESAKAYLTAITTRLAIDHLRSARVRELRGRVSSLPSRAGVVRTCATDRVQ